MKQPIHVDLSLLLATFVRIVSTKEHCVINGSAHIRPLETLATSGPEYESSTILEPCILRPEYVQYTRFVCSGYPIWCGMSKSRYARRY